MIRRGHVFGSSVLIVCLGVHLACGGGSMPKTNPSPAPVVWNSQQNVTYGAATTQYGTAQQSLDVYQPPGRQGTAILPAIVFVHGGGWSGGDKADYTDLAKTFAQEGYVTFSVNYRLVWSADMRYPVPYDDVQRAMRFIRTHASSYGIDPLRVGAIGGSAGGHLVGLLGTTDTRDNSDSTLASVSSRATCVVDMFGPMDLMSPLPTTPENYDNMVLTLIGDTRANVPRTYQEASPIDHIDARTVPFLIFQGGQDPIVPPAQSQGFHDALLKAGIESQLVIYPSEGHGFSDASNNADCLRKIQTFFRNHLGTAR